MAKRTEGKKTRDRSSGMGSVYQRADGMWVAALDLGRDENNKRQRAVRYKPTKREAEAALAEMVTDLRRGQFVDPTTATVAEFMREWLESIRPPVVSLRTWVDYEARSRVHIIPELGRIPLAQLSPVHIQQLYRSRLRMGRSPRTVVRIHEILHNALSQAVKWRVIPVNPADGVKRPQVSRRSAHMQFLTFEEARVWLRSLQDDPLESLHLTAIMTGMRQGELLGLRWSDVDFDLGTITVGQTVWIWKRQVIFKPYPKNREIRQVPIPPAVVAKLRARRAQQAWDRRMAGDTWADHDLVWTRPNGLPLRAEYARTHFYRSLADAGLKRIRFHDLRHSAATLLLALGVPLKDVSEWLGHAGIEITADLYGHTLPDAHRRSALKLEDALLK